MKQREQGESRKQKAVQRKCLLPSAFCFLLSALFVRNGCGRSTSTESRSHPEPPPQPPPAALLPSDDEGTMTAIRFLEDRVKRDPDDLIAYNKLAVYYLQLVRETGDVKYLELASRAAHASLNAVPKEQNLGGLVMLAQSEYAAHDFLSARDHAKEMTEYEPRKGYGYQMLGDALLELGDYDGANTAYARMKQSAGP